MNGERNEAALNKGSQDGSGEGTGVPSNSVKINLVSRETIEGMDSENKVRYILEQVMSGTVLVLEQGLTPMEEAELYKRTMNTIDHNTFIGIEIQGIAPSEVKKRNFLERVLGIRRKEAPRMSVIGPAHLLKTIYKDGRQIKAVIVTKGEEAEVIGPDDEVSEKEMETLFSGLEEEKLEESDLEEWEGVGKREDRDNSGEEMREEDRDIGGEEQDVRGEGKNIGMGKDSGEGGQEDGGQGEREVTADVINTEKEDNIQGPTDSRARAEEEVIRPRPADIEGRNVYRVLKKDKEEEGGEERKGE